MGAAPITCPIIVLPTALPDEVSSHLGAEKKANSVLYSILGDDDEDLPSKNWHVQYVFEQMAKEKSLITMKWVQSCS